MQISRGLPPLDLLLHRLSEERKPAMEHSLSFVSDKFLRQISEKPGANLVQERNVGMLLTMIPAFSRTNEHMCKSALVRAF